MADIFLSYARADQPRVEQLAAALEEAGYTVWWDRHIKGGSEFSKDIEGAITEARAVIVVWSEASAESEWVREEASYARDHGKLIPVSIDDAPPPFGYRQRQAIDLNDADAEPQLHATLDALIDGEHGEIDTAPATRRKLSPVLLAIPLLLLVAAAGWYFFAHRSDADTQIALEDQRGVMVLPFLAQSSGEDDQYFADGLTEEILNRLDALEELRVIPRTTAFTFRDTDRPLNEIADQVQVDHIVEGTFRRDGDRVRVTARLVDAKGERTIWSDDYGATVEDVFEVQADIAEKVATALDVLLDRDKMARMDEVGIDNPEAYALYAKGYQMLSDAHSNLNDLTEFAEAVELFDQAFAMAPKLAAAQLGASDFYSHILMDEAGGRMHDELPQDVRKGAREQLDRRLRLAREATANEHERMAIELVRLAFSDDWSQIPQLSERFYTSRGHCAYSVWPGFGYAVYGKAQESFDLYASQYDCRAYDRNFWGYLSLFNTMTGDIDQIDPFIERGLATPGAREFVDHYRVDSLLARGQFDEARTLVEQRQSEGGRYYVALASGDRDNMPSLEWALATPPYKAVQWLAIMGEQRRADGWAAQIDAAPAGPTVLQIVVDECLCGAPFDIARTPNFRARLNELGASWPPRSPIDWPLKKEPGT